MVVDTFKNEFDQTICSGDTLEFEGIEVFESGTYSHVEELMSGCIEQTILNLIVLPALSVNDLSIIGDHGNNDGAILVEITGGSPPYTFLWNSGQTTESIFNIMHGTYTLTVTDKVGCKETFQFVVPMGTSTNGVSADVNIKLWPTLLSAASEVYVYSSLHADQIKTITWCDINGRFVAQHGLKQPSVSGVSTLNVPDNIQPGLYFIRITFAEGETSWYKVILH